MCGARVTASLGVILVVANAFNLDVEHAQVFSDPEGQEGSYFGFSVALMRLNPGSNTGGGRLVVGAPRGNVTKYSYSDIHQPGVTYLCGVGEQRQNCQAMVLDPFGNDIFPGPPSYRYDANKNNAWIGASVAVQDNGEGGIVVCGPRWKNQHFRNYYLMNGICYLTSGIRNTEINAKKLIPLLNSGHQGYRIEEGYDPDRKINQVFYYAYGGAGLSVSFVGNSSEIIIGAPGVFDWMGSVIKYRDSKIPSRGNVPNFSSSNTVYDRFITPNPYRNDQITPNGYLGYSVGSGRFYRSPKVYYASGAPRAGNLKGKVVIFEFPEANGDPFIVNMELEGYQFGEYFGSSICVVDLNSDGLDDLVIGAPLHSMISQGYGHQTGDEGRIYVFINKDGGIMAEITTQVSIMGTQALGSRFGTAISNIGDLNGDGYPDIAVGAPYENAGAGAVYIYHGKADGINPKFVQRITAQQINKHTVRGFGISITKGSDIDGNHYNDIAVGSYSSGHAILLKSHPVITFHSKLVANVTKISINATGFMVISCLSYTGKHPPASLVATTTLKADLLQGRATFVTPLKKTNLLSFDWELENSREDCKYFTLEILGMKQDFSKPIQIAMESTVAESNAKKYSVPSNHREIRKRDLGDGFCKFCPVLDPSQPKSVTLKVPYSNGCGEDSICQTEIKTEGSFINIGLPFVIGTSPTLQLKAVIKNSGDPAFFSQAKIAFPKTTPLIRIPKNCEEVKFEESSDEKTNEDTLICDIGSPLQTNGKVELLLEFDARFIASGSEMLVYKVNASSVGEEMNKEDNNAMIVLPMKTITDVSVSGKSSQNQFYYNKETDAEYQKIYSFSHIYEVKNYGPSPVDQVKIVFNIPTMMPMGTENNTFVRVYHPQTILNSQSITCSVKGPAFYVDPKDNKPNDLFLDNDQPSTPSEEVNFLRKKEPPRSRERRSVLSSPVYSTAYLLSNKTLFINCSNSEVGCMTVTCITGPLKASQTGAVFIFPFRVTPSHFDNVFENKDAIVYSSFGSVEILGLPHSVQLLQHKPDFSEVHTMFLGKLGENKVDSWIIAVSIACGIFILFLVVMALIKMGFFKRDKKEELELLKNKEQMESSFENELD